MPDLDYGYEITIVQNATSDPTAVSIANQWQRQAAGNTTWEDISGASGATYTTASDDRGAKIRLEQSLHGVPVYSNELKVTSVLPPAKWKYKGLLHSASSNAVVYSPEMRTFAVGMRGNIAKFSTNGGVSWTTKTGHSFDVSIGVDTATSSGNNFWVFGGYGGTLADDNVAWISEDLGSWRDSGGFPRQTYIYGVFRMTDSIYMGVDFNGDVWGTYGGVGGTFSKTGQNISSSYVSFKGKRDSSGRRLGTGQSSVYRYESADGIGPNSLVYTKGTCNFTGNNKSVLDVHYHGGLYVAVGSESQLFTSYDCSAWSRISLDNIFPYSLSISAVTFAGNKWWVAGSYLGQIYLASSTSGFSWRKEPLPTSLPGSSMGGTSYMASNGNDEAVWIFSESSSPYKAYYCILDN